MTLKSPPTGYALFDLDQTIVQWDTQLLFCNFVLKRQRLRTLYLLGFIPFSPFAKILGPEIMKRVFLNYLAGMDAKLLDQYAREFVDELVPSRLYSEVVEIVEKGDRLPPCQYIHFIGQSVLILDTQHHSSLGIA